MSSTTSNKSSAGPMAPQISMAHVTKLFFPETPVLGPLTLKINKGEFVAVLGPSGTGKSTLLRLIAGLESVTNGELTVVSSKPFDRAFVFQDPHLLPWRTAIQNVTLPQELSGVPEAEARKRGQDQLALVGLSGAENLYPSQMSGGMRMRTSLARALTLSPDLLLLDEPLAALDESTRMSLALRLRQIWQEKRMTVILVTHSLSEALLMADRILILKNRPATLAADIAIDLPEQRGTKLRSDPRYTKYVEELGQHFIGEA